MEDNQCLIHLEADLGLSLGLGFFKLKERFPGQVIDCGIQEANMVGVAAGLSATGKIPFVHSFAPFISRRACDQVFISGCYSKSNIKLIGSDPGVLAAFNGGTHMPFEDIGIFRTFPELTIVEPSDSTMLKNLIPRLIGHEGMVYIRLARKNMVQIYEPDSSFTIGKAIIVREGTDISLFSSGIMIVECIRAADILAKEGIKARVVDTFTLKPLDEEMVLKCARDTGAIVTAENHNIINGLGAAVANVLVSGKAVPMGMIGVDDQFGQVGPQEYLMKVYKMTAEDIAEKAKKVIARK
jgi:transketolase